MISGFFGGYMYGKFLKLVVLLVFCFSLSGCGRAVIEAGDHVTDNSVVNEGRFVSKTVDTSFISGNFLNESYAITDTGYSYILSKYNYEDNTVDYFYVSFDDSAKTSYSGALDLPISSNDKMIVFSDVCKELTLYPYDLSIENGYILYESFSFDKDGSFSAICEICATVADRDSYGNMSFFVKWDKSGKCTSVSETIDPGFEFAEYRSVVSNDGRIYRTDDSGISVVDADGNYQLTYFNYINSDIDGLRFDCIAIRDENSFSAIYRDSNENSVLAVFNADNGSADKNAILVACSGLDPSIRDLIRDYNSHNNDYRIAVRDYSLWSSSESEGWELLKKDIEAGFSPDIIINSSGLDDSFIAQMSSEGKLVTFNNLIKNDKALKKTEFTEQASGLFYMDESYCIVPSYEYRTLVGNVDYMGLHEGWSKDDFLSYANSIASTQLLFSGGTGEEFLKMFLAYDGNEMIDMESKTSSFNSSEFISFLELAHDLPSDIIAAETLQYSIENKGEVKFRDISCLGLGDFHLDAMVQAQGEYVDIGFPGVYGESGGVLAATNSIMIMSNSAAANECWNILKTCFTDDFQAYPNSGIPVTVSGFEKWKDVREFSYHDALYYRFTLNGVEYTVTSPGDDECNAIEDHIASCKKIEFSDFTIEEIVLKYARQYFAGEISSAEAAQKIDEEVESYLNS